MEEKPQQEAIHVEAAPKEEAPIVPGASKQKPWFIIGLTIFTLFLLGTTSFFAYQNYQLKKKKASDTSLITSEPVELKTYNNNQFGTYDYQVYYPSNWKVNNIFQPNADVVRFTPANVATDDFIAINCPTDSSTKKEMSKPWEWENTEYEYMGGYSVKFFKKTQINGFEAIQYVSSPRDINQTQTRELLTTEILRDDRTAVCIITTTINESPGDTVEKRATSKVIYQQVVSSFKYGNNDNLNVKTHCVVTGNRGQLCLEANQEPPHTGELPVTQEYECLNYAICEKQANESCGWTLTEGYNRCMGK